MGRSSDALVVSLSAPSIGESLIFPMTLLRTASWQQSSFIPRSGIQEGDCSEGGQLAQEACYLGCIGNNWCTASRLQTVGSQQDDEVSKRPYSAVPYGRRRSGQGGSLYAKIKIKGLIKRPLSSAVAGWWRLRLVVTVSEKLEAPTSPLVGHAFPI